MDSLQLGLQPTWTNSIVFNQCSIASIIATLTLTLSVNGSLECETICLYLEVPTHHEFDLHLSYSVQVEFSKLALIAYHGAIVT